MYFKKLQIALVFCVTIFSACRHAAPQNTPESTPRSYVLKNVTVISMVAVDQIRYFSTVVIENGKISSINGAVPKGAKVIDCKGKWLIPGLIDMHVHIPVDGHFNNTYPGKAAAIFTNTQDIMTPFIANGVTTVFELNARAGHFGQRNEILRGDVFGPRMVFAALNNGGDSQNGRIVNDSASARQAVRSARAEGYEFIKVYSQLNEESYYAILEEASKYGMKVIGHIPNAFQGKLNKAFVSNFGMIAHAEELAKHSKNYTDEDAANYAVLARQNGTWLSPTLTVIDWAASQAKSLEPVRSSLALKYVHPLLQSKWLTANNYNKGSTEERIARLDKINTFNKKLVKAFKEAGVPIVAGTDAGSSGVIWGFSLHDELQLLVEAGMSNYQVLDAATRLPAKWLGLDSLIGTIEAGKFADLILLDENPLADIRNTRKIAGVFVNGVWLDKKNLDRMLSELARRNEAGKEKWFWDLRDGY